MGGAELSTPSRERAASSSVGRLERMVSELAVNTLLYGWHFYLRVALRASMAGSGAGVARPADTILLFDPIEADSEIR
jgi:hypothetical protein